MGLSNFPSSSEGVLPILVMNTVISVALLKKFLTSTMESLLNSSSNSFDENQDHSFTLRRRRRRRRGVASVKVKKSSSMECCVCLCKFKEEEEVSELSCKHYFHKNCLDKWFDNYHVTCPLCRSIH